MRQFFYLVSFAYEDESGSSAFDLGVFSSLALAKKKIEASKNLSEFSDYSELNFLITPIGVEVKEKKPKENRILYQIDHEYIDGEIGYTNVFGLTETREEAKKLVKELKKHTRIGKKYPDGFSINKCRVNLMTS